MCDDYHVFLIETLLFNRLLLYEIYHLTELPFDWLSGDVMFIYLLDDLILGFCYSNLTWETGGFEFALTITMPSYFWEVFFNLVVVVLWKNYSNKGGKTRAANTTGFEFSGSRL